MSEVSDAIKQAIIDGAAGPKAMSVDGTSYTGHSIGDLVKAKEEAANDAAGSRRKLPVRLAKIRHGGPV